MKRYLGVILAIAFVLVAIGFSYNKYQKKALEAARDADAARIKIEYLERVGWIRSNPDDKAYKDEVNTFFRWYFKEINEHLNRFGGNRAFDDYLAELERRAEGGRDQQIAEKKAYFEYAKKLFDLLKGGTYEPVWTGSDKGMRLDVVSTDSVMVAGEPKVRYQLVLWGPQREMREESKNLKKMVTSASFNVTWKLYDDKGKLIGEMNAPGDPSMKIDFPERFIAQFPPQMVIGHYDVELLPDNVKTMEIAFNVNSRSNSGGDARAAFTWKLETPAEWKLRPGEAWKGAEESVRPEDEINPTAKK